MRDHLDDQEISAAIRTQPTRISLLGWMARLVIFLAVGVGIAAATMALHRMAPQTIAQQPLPPMRVVATTVQLEPGYAAPIAFAGVVEPSRQASLAFERSGRVTAVLVDEGDTVSAGAVLARLDTAALTAERTRLEAQRARLAAALELAALTLERQEGLSDNARAVQRLDDARLSHAQAVAAVAEIDAALQANAVALDETVLLAPFDAQIAARSVDEGSVVAPGMAVLDLLEDTAGLVRVGVSPEAARQLEMGSTHQLVGPARDFEATLVAIRPDLDPVTRTQSALFEPTESGPAFGETVKLVLRQWHEDAGAWLPLSALVEAERGLWAVYAVDETGDGVGSVRRALVEVLAVEGERVFVRTALPGDTRIVATGVHRLAPGLAVVPESQS